VAATALRAARAAAAAGVAGTAEAHLATARDAGAPDDAALAARIAWLAEAPQREARRRLARLAELRGLAAAGGDPSSELAGWSADADQDLNRAVAELAGDAEPALRVLAVRAAAASGGWLADDRLLALIGDAHPEVRRAALIALVHRQPAGLLLPAARAVAAHDPALGPLLWGWASRDRAVHTAAASDPADRELLWVCGFHREWAAGAAPDSADPAVLRRLILAYRPQNNQGGKTRLRELGRTLAAIDPGDPDGWSAQGQAAVLWGLHAEAWTAMRQGHAQARERHRLLRWYSYAAGWVGEEQAVAEALAELAAALRAGRFADDGERAEALLCLVDHGRDAALVRSEADALVRRNPYRLDLRLMAARAALAAGDAAAAASHAAAASDQWPNNPESYRLRARALVALGLRDDALREARLALVRQPRLGANLQLHAEVLLEHRRGAEAVDRARLALRMLPSNQGVCAVGARAALRHGFPGDALAFLRTWSGGEGPNRPATVLTARLAVELGVPGEAIALAAAHDPPDARMLRPLLASIPSLLHEGWPGMAGRDLAAVQVREALAALRAGSAQAGAAGVLLARAVELDPDIPGMALLQALAAGDEELARRLAADAPAALAWLANPVRAAPPGRLLPLPPAEWGQRPLPPLRLTGAERSALQALLPFALPAVPEPPADAPRRFDDLQLPTAPPGWDWPPRTMPEWLERGEP
jgi:tetratricopeptide (TPR) repeat protein